MDSLGLLLEAVVHSAGIQDQDGARLVLAQAHHTQGGQAERNLQNGQCELGRGEPGQQCERGHYVRRLKLIWVDAKYAGKLEEWVQEAYGCTLEVVRRPKDAKGFVLLARRWVIERTFGWLGRYRRLSRDYEGLLLTSEVLIYAAMVRLMLARLSRLESC